MPFHICLPLLRLHPPLEPIEFEFDLETQLKVVKQSAANAVDFDLPLHVNVLFLKTVEDVDLPDETVDDLTLLLKDHQETFASSSAGQT